MAIIKFCGVQFFQGKPQYIYLKHVLTYSEKVLLSFCYVIEVTIFIFGYFIFIYFKNILGIFLMGEMLPRIS